MLAKQDKIQNSVLVSMAGLKPNSLKSLSDKGFGLYSCVDNDEKGIKFTADNGLIPCNRILAENGVKDFNELLQLITHNREIAAQKSQAQNHAAPQTASKTAPMPSRSRR
ncbi:MAG: toprim domain-containing protein [Bacteroides sp.]|nr:toprim domain-containing protein [Roseburia sp.]MCM1462556.1 toprim domain-containing protein [Bacteroides sp.]